MSIRVNTVAFFLSRLQVDEDVVAEIPASHTGTLFILLPVDKGQLFSSLSEIQKNFTNPLHLAFSRHSEDEKKIIIHCMGPLEFCTKYSNEANIVIR